MVMICQVSKLNRTSTLHFDYFKGKDIFLHEKMQSMQFFHRDNFCFRCSVQKKKLEQSRAKLTG